MVNEIRTALLNLPAWSGTDTPVAEEYVPASYRPRRLTDALAAARSALFGDGADRVGMNLTLARLLSYAHASPFLPDVTANDTRITYDPNTGPLVFDRIGPAVTGSASVGWTGSSGFQRPGRGYGTWSVSTNGSGGYTVISDGTATTSGSVAVVATGDAIMLPGSLLGLVVPHNTAGNWTVTLLVPPAHSFSALAELSDSSSLFRPSGSARDRNWYAVWNGNGPAYTRSTAAALALATRTLELKN